MLTDQAWFLCKRNRNMRNFLKINYRLIVGSCNRVHKFVHTYKFVFWKSFCLETYRLDFLVITSGSLAKIYIVLSTIKLVLFCYGLCTRNMTICIPKRYEQNICFHMFCTKYLFPHVLHMQDFELRFRYCILIT